MSKEKTKDRDSQWSSLIGSFKKLGDKSPGTHGWAKQLSQLRLAAAFICYASLTVSGVAAIYVSVQTIQLAVEPVAIGWSTLSCWFVFYHWAQRYSKPWTASISLFFSLATSVALALFCLQYVGSTGLTQASMSEGFVEARFFPVLKGIAFVLFSFISTTVFHFVSGFYVTEG